MSYRDRYDNLVDEETGYIMNEYPSDNEYDDDDMPFFGIRSADDMNENCW